MAARILGISVFYFQLVQFVNQLRMVPAQYLCSSSQERMCYHVLIAQRDVKCALATTARAAAA